MSDTTPNIEKFKEELKHLRDEHHGFLMALSRESDVNFNNLSSMLTGNRKMGFKVFFALKKHLPAVKGKFTARKTKKV